MKGFCVFRRISLRTGARVISQGCFINASKVNGLRVRRKQIVNRVAGINNFFFILFSQYIEQR